MFLADLENLHDIGVLQAARSLRLRLESRVSSRGDGRRPGWNIFSADEAFQPGWRAL